jgi:WD40 repeat protein
VHRTASITGGNIEGAYFDKATGDFMLYGFRSQDFVLRNESKLTDIVSIASGGFRRSWDFIPGDKNNSTLFAWKDGYSLMTTRVRAAASTLLRAGGHGREIKAMDVFNSTDGDRPLFATGAEDTTVRLFTPTSSLAASPWGSFECLRVLDTHRSGIQQVTWSKDGRYLFTSAAYEEFFVWSVRTIPIFGVATNLMAASPKDDVNSDLRIPSFDLVEVEEVDGQQGFLLCLALSNSVFKVRVAPSFKYHGQHVLTSLQVFHFSPSNGAQFTLLARGKYMTNCLTQAHFLISSSSVSLITAATDGYFTLWDLTSTLEPFYTITQSTLKAKHSFDGTSISPENITCESRYQIHSNSVKGMELVPISDTATVIVAGGDDNSLSVSLLRTHPSDTGLNAQVATVSIPDAHAASVTTVKVLNQQISRGVTSNTESIKFTVASSGNDHRVKSWSIAVDLSQPGTQAIIVGFLLDTYSSVADISSLGLLRGPGNGLPAESQVPGSEINKSRLVVCGEGMEMFAAGSDPAPSA